MISTVILSSRGWCDVEKERGKKGLTPTPSALPPFLFSIPFLFLSCVLQLMVRVLQKNFTSPLHNKLHQKLYSHQLAIVNPEHIHTKKKTYIFGCLFCSSCKNIMNKTDQISTLRTTSSSTFFTIIFSSRSRHIIVIVVVSLKNIHIYEVSLECAWESKGVLHLSCFMGDEKRMIIKKWNVTKGFSSTLAELSSSFRLQRAKDMFLGIPLGIFFIWVIRVSFHLNYLTIITRS